MANEQYFKSWASYAIPMRPVHPISYEESEELSSYYLAVYDQQGNLTRFTKFVREALRTVDLKADDDLTLGTRLYFEATRSGQIGQRIDFSATKGLENYLSGVVATLDRNVELKLMSQTVFFEDEYKYWPNGSLKHRIAWKSDGSRTETFFDESGREIVPQAVPN